MNNDVLCVVPCRMGSKGVARKNLQLCGDVTLLDRALDFAYQISVHVILTTDDPKVVDDRRGAPIMAQIALPPRFHGDDSRAIDVWKDAWEAAETMCKEEFAYSLYLEPSSPLREPWMAFQALDKLRNRGLAAAWTVEEVPTRYITAKQYSLVEHRIYPEQPGYDGKPRQQLPKRYVQNGAVYGMARYWAFSGRNQVYSPGSTGAVVTPMLVNIDSEQDLVEADRVLRKNAAQAALNDN